MPSDDAKAVKKEDEKRLSCMLESRKKKATNGKVKKEEPKDEYDDGDFQKPLKKAASRSNVKKEHNAVDDDDNDHKPISFKNSSASIKADSQKEVKKKKIKGEEKKVEVEQNGKKKERKVYDLPGQKRDPPEERDPLRIFYETLYKQVPHSEMAQFWMMESGLLSFDEAKKVFEKKQTKNKFISPTKAISAEERNAESVTIKKKLPSSLVSLNRRSTTESKAGVKQSKKRKVDDGCSEDDSDDDFSIKKAVKKPKPSN